MRGARWKYSGWVYSGLVQRGHVHLYASVQMDVVGGAPSGESSTAGPARPAYYSGVAVSDWRPGSVVPLRVAVASASSTTTYNYCFLVLQLG